MAPSATRCVDGVRPPTVRYTASRVSISRTGRPVARAASAARIVPGQTLALPPNAPPTNGAITRTFVSGTSNRCARWRRVQSMFCVPSWTVSASPCHDAVVACGSSALWLCIGVVNRRSTRTGAAASAASASPLRPPPGIRPLLFCGVAPGSAAWKSAVDGCSAYRTRTSSAAASAASSVSATVTATGWPFQCTSSVFR